MKANKPRPTKHSTDPLAIPKMPFDDALRKILSAPPQPRAATRKKSKRALSKRTK